MLFPILRSQIDAMIWVHEFAEKPIETWLTAELASLDQRSQWPRNVKLNEIKSEMQCWKKCGAKVSNSTQRIDALEDFLPGYTRQEKKEGVELGWATIWKMCSQSAHLGPNQIGHLMMEKSDNGAEPNVVIGKPIDEKLLKYLTGESLRTLRFSNERLGDCLTLTCETGADGTQILKDEYARPFTEIWGCVKSELSKSACGKVTCISPEVPRDDDRV